ncbi:MAG: DTW domain-containing protein [Herminiimonas sp.]|nr:DTW domain-containing protein [Herminiimonas sp.]
MHSLTPPRQAGGRAMCGACLRPKRTCICQWITPVDNEVEVLILQHPLEVDNAKGSARLLHLCLSNSRLVTGEAFSEAALRRWLHAPFSADGIAYETSASPLRQALLLYPDDIGPDSGVMVVPESCRHDLPADPARVRLVILDATWRKSRKQLYCNPLLQQLPRLALRGTGASHYRIRTAHRKDQLSTFEATCQALVQLEGAGERYQPMLAAFDGFVEQQIGYGFAARVIGEEEK